MKLKTPLLVLASLLLVGCAEVKDAVNDIINNQTEQNENQDSENTGTKDNENQGGTSGDNSGNQGENQGGTSGDNSGNQGGTSGENEGGTGDNTGDNTGGNSGGNSGDNTGGGTVIDPETGEEIDLEGLVEVAYAPEGATSETLTDWTDEMKAILSKYLGGVVPPFFYMDNMRVSYDDLEILQARGDSRENIAEDYCDLLNETTGYQAYVDEDQKGRTHVYGRAFGDGFLIEIDALDANGIFSINFNRMSALTSWPSDAFNQIFASEYESSESLPALTYDNAQYIIESDMMSNIFIYCMGAPASAVETYCDVLEDAKYTVQAMTGDYEGAYTAMSRDKRIIVFFYFDGTGIQIEVTHGEGENYTTWADCLSALDDFARTELRLDHDISNLFPEIPTAEQYTIERDVRGVIKVVAHKGSSFKQEDIFNYVMKCMSSDYKYTASVKDDIYWLITEDKSFALYLTLEDYISDLGEVWSDLRIAVTDYRIFEGYTVTYGSWPSSRVDNVVNQLGGASMIKMVPPIKYSDATYYCYSNLTNNVKIDIVGLPSGTLEAYKKVLTDNFEYETTATEKGFSAIDRSKKIKLTVETKGEELHWELEKYIPDTTSNGVASFDFSSTAQLTSTEPGWVSATWTNGDITFKVLKGESSIDVGNYGHYIGTKPSESSKFNPLVVFQNQKINISAANGKKVSKLEFYAHEAVTLYNRYDISYANLGEITYEGASVATNESLLKVTLTLAAPVSSLTIDVAKAFSLKELKVTFTE